MASIEQGEELAPGAFRAERFVEKPDAKRLNAMSPKGVSSEQRYFPVHATPAAGGTGKACPYILGRIRRAVGTARREADRLYPDPSAFARSPSQSIDHAVMEKSERVAVVPVDMGWSDVGSWEAHAIADKDEEANALTGDVVMIDSEGSLVGPKARWWSKLV